MKKPERPASAWPSINGGFQLLPPQMQAEGVLLLAEKGQALSAIAEATGIWVGEARDTLRLRGPWRLHDSSTGAAE